jgi:PAS domain S-box-containing protein
VPSRNPPLSDAVLRAIAREAADGLFITDESLRIVWVNTRACEQLERPLDEIVGRSIPELFWDADEEADLPQSLEHLREGRPTVTRRAFRTPSGARRVLEVSAKSVGDGLLLGIARDVTLQLEEVRRMALSEESFRALVESSPDAAIVHSDGAILYANHATASMLGFGSSADLIGTSVIGYVHPDARLGALRRMEALRTGAVSVPFVDTRLVCTDGRSITASVGAVSVIFAGRPSIAVIVRDVTEQRKMHAQLAHAEKMASIGLLAAGVAHEINNPLAYLMLRLRAIETTTSALERAIEDTRDRLTTAYGREAAGELLGSLDEAFANQLRDHTKTAEEGAERVRKIVQDLRVFSRADDEGVQLIDVRAPLSLALSLAAHDLAQKARIVTELAEVPPVEASEGRLAQVFLNLLVNALHAIPEGHPEENEVRVSTRFAGGEVQVSVRDTGVGIARGELPRLSEPFYTTKPPGIGTGLGLSICHGIVASLGGVIRVESEVGAGTTFTVAIPVREPVTRSSHPHSP